MINLTIDMVAEEALVWKTDTTSVTLVADTYEYEMPTDFMLIHKITMADSDGDFDGQDPVPPEMYRIVHGTTPLLHFSIMPEHAQVHDTYYGGLWATESLTADRALRIEGLGSPDTLSADTDTCPMSPAYITFQAAALLHGQKTRGTEHDPDAHFSQAQFWQGRADIERARVVNIQLPPNSKRVRE
jgi:hypothetical protein